MNSNDKQSKSALTQVETELMDRVHSYFSNHDPERFYFVYATETPFSNVHPCSITDRNLKFHSSEQYMTCQKARVFNDENMARKILRAETPGKCKALGRAVKNFDQQIWHENRTRIVSDAACFK
ncbi:unnamed protein product, partial [Adineta ricciae]